MIGPEEKNCAWKSWSMHDCYVRKLGGLIVPSFIKLDMQKQFFLKNLIFVLRNSSDVQAIT